MSKKKEPQPVLVVALLDRTGSMQSCKTDIEGAWTALINDQRKEPGELRVSLYQFDHHLGTMCLDVVYEDKDVHEDGTEHLVLTPRGMTPLWDAVGVTIARTDAIVAKAKAKPKVVLVVMTDGLNNMSREYTLAQVRALVEARQGQGWTVTFLAAGLGAAAQGADMGVAGAAVVDYAEVGQAVNSASAYISRGRAGGQSVWAAGYTTQEREAAQGKDEE
jgi:hypothetical protein